MCGITGRVDYSRDLTQERSVIEAMTETINQNRAAGKSGGSHLPTRKTPNRYMSSG